MRFSVAYVDIYCLKHYIVYYSNSVFFKFFIVDLLFMLLCVYVCCSIFFLFDYLSLFIYITVRVP